jgi:hypothetical protein
MPSASPSVAPSASPSAFPSGASKQSESQILEILSSFEKATSTTRNRRRLASCSFTSQEEDNYERGTANFTCNGINSILTNSTTTSTWACDCLATIKSDDCTPTSDGTAQKVVIEYYVNVDYCSDDPNEPITPVSPAEFSQFADDNPELYLADLAASGVDTSTINVTTLRFAVVSTPTITNSNKGVVIGLTSAAAAAALLLVLWLLTLRKEKDQSGELPTADLTAVQMAGTPPRVSTTGTRISTTILAEQGNMAVNTANNEFLVVYDDSTVNDTVSVNSDFRDDASPMAPDMGADEIDDYEESLDSDDNTRSSGITADSLTTAEIMGDLMQLSAQIPQQDSEDLSQDLSQDS